MAFTPGSSSGASNGATDVEMVAAPSASVQRMVNYITVYNKDTAAATVTVKLVDGGVDRIIVKQVLAADDTLEMTDTIVLDATDESIEMVLAGAVAANELDWTASWADLS